MSVAFRRIILPRHHDKVFSGQHVTIMAETIDTTVVDHLVNATETPVIALYDPNNVRLVNDADMVPVSHGLYKHHYPVPWDAPLGVYTGNFTALLDGGVARLERISLFKVIKTSVPSIFTYQIMIDQDGVAWYWWIDRAGQIVSSLTLPFLYTKQAVALANSYHWMVAVNPLVETRYISPALDGTPMVSPTQPAIGTGITSLITFTGLTEDEYQLTLTVTDEIIPVTL